MCVPRILKSIANEEDVNWNNTREANSNILNKYESIFYGIGKMKDVKVKWAIDESVTSIAQKHCRVPFHLRDKIDNELKRLFDAGITEDTS